MMRLHTFVAVDSKIIELMKRRGNPKGRTRKFYSILTSPDRPLSNRAIKRPLLRLYEERAPLARLIGYIHGDTEHTHPHGWQSARLVNGYKFHVGKVRVKGAWVDKYNDLSETYLRFYAEQVNDPSLIEKYLAKKREWGEKRARIEEALSLGKRPPAMPFRERHLYDELGERRERKERRGREANGEELGPKKPAAPDARCRRTWECAELWGKLIHAMAISEAAHEKLIEFESEHRQMEFTVDERAWSLDQISRERDLLFANHWQERGLTAQEEKRTAQLSMFAEKVGEKIEAQRQSLLQELEETDLRFQQHRTAWEKTVENRARVGLPEIKYPLPNTRQLEEINRIAGRCFSVEMSRYTHAYELLDRPQDREGLARTFSEKWGRVVMAEVAVHEQAQRLLARTREDSAPGSQNKSPRSANSTLGRADEDQMQRRIFEEWIGGHWDAQDMRQAIPCIRDESLRQQAEKYLRAREYWEATKEILGDDREGAEIARQPQLETSEIARIRALLQSRDAIPDKEARARLELIADLTAREAEPTRAEQRRIIEGSLPASAPPPQYGRSRAASPSEDFNVTRPFDDRWVARLSTVVDLNETRALAAAMRPNGSREKMEATRNEAVEMREKLDLVQWVRARMDLSEPPLVRTPSAERNEMVNLERFISQQLIRESQWKPEQIEQIEEFEHRVPVKSRDDCAVAVEKAKEHLRLIAEEKVREGLTLSEQRVAKLGQALNERDERYSLEAFNSMNLEIDCQSDIITAKAQGLVVTYGQIIREHGFTSEQVNDKDLRQRARTVVSKTVDLAERLRDTLFIALLDKPTMKELTERVNAVGIDLRIQQARDRSVTAVDLKYKDYTIDTSALSPRLNGRVIADGADAASEKRYPDQLTRTIHRCLEMALVTESERERIMDGIRRQGGSQTTREIESMLTTRYALLVVSEVRAGSERTWEAIDKRILDVAWPKDHDTREHLIKCWSVTRHLEVEEREKERMPYRPVVPEGRTPELTRALENQERNSRSSANRSSSRGR